MKILLVEDEKITRKTLSDFILKEGYEVTSTGDGTEALEILRLTSFQVVITDLMLPGVNGMEILRIVKEQNPGCFVIIMTAYATVETAVEALKLGAYDYLVKPFSPDRLMSMLQHIGKLFEVIDENEKLKDRLNFYEHRILIGNSAPIKKLLETIKLVAKHDSTILIEGESGTGKEICARTIHQFSNRNNNAFVAVNCAAIPESLLESEMFGHEKGSFTGANKRHSGYFERANNGTLFIDDIDDLPLPMQVKLLRVLQEKEITRIGGTETIPINTRIICATKVDLRKKVEEKLFREDLFYRLNIVPLKLPPLRERKDDIPLLVEHFLKKLKVRQSVLPLPGEAIARLMNYDWYGNVRELENFIERVIALSEPGTFNVSLLETLPTTTVPTVAHKTIENEYPSFDEYIGVKEKEIIEWALVKAQNNLTRAAELLQLPRTTLRSKLDKLQKVDS